ncbi:MAG: HAMP domain-containing sensor histidine kinase, partial [Alphaproteobacteria bacterium]
VANVVTVGFDITERKAASRALEEAKNAAETANRLKTEFLANMSHELRTPLNAIIGFASMMNQQVLGPVGTPRYVDYAHDIAGSASHLLDIINDILDVSRIEAGVLDLHDEWVEMATTINDAVRAVSEEASGRRVQIVINMEPELPPLRADSARLQQVIVNLLSNAVKASSDGGEVYVNALERDGSIIVAIADRGCGMDSAEISTALSRFGYLENVMTRRHAGAGLGLPLANDLVRLHGGRLDVESRKGQGTTMTVILPIRRPEPGHQGAEPVAGLDSPLSSQGSV